MTCVSGGDRDPINALMTSLTVELARSVAPRLTDNARQSRASTGAAARSAAEQQKQKGAVFTGLLSVARRRNAGLYAAISLGFERSLVA